MSMKKKFWQSPTIKNELPVNETLGCCETGEDACGWALNDGGGGEPFNLCDPGVTACEVPMSQPGPPCG